MSDFPNSIDTFPPQPDIAGKHIDGSDGAQYKSSTMLDNFGNAITAIETYVLDGLHIVRETITMAELLACGEGGTYKELVAGVPNKLIMPMGPMLVHLDFGLTIPTDFTTYDLSYPPDVHDQRCYAPGLLTENELSINVIGVKPDGSNTPQGNASLDPHIDPLTFGRVPFSGANQLFLSDLLRGAPIVVFSDTAGHLAGPIVTSHVAAGGTGYAPGDTGEITSDLIVSAANNATYTVLTAPGGVVATVSVTPHPAYAYYKAGTTYGTSVTTGGGNGGLTIGVDTIPAADGDFSVSFPYIFV